MRSNPYRLPLRLVALAALAVTLSGCVAAVVGGTAAGVGHDRRSWTTVISDRNIQATAYDNFNKDKELALKNNVSIVVYNGVMLLAGEVRTEELKQRAEQRVAGYEGVRRLVNEIEVREPPHVVGKLVRKGLVEAEPLALGDDRVLADGDAIGAQLHDHDVTRHDADEEEDGDGHPEQ